MALKHIRTTKQNQTPDEIPEANMSLWHTGHNEKCKSYEANILTTEYMMNPRLYSWLTLIKYAIFLGEITLI